MIEALVAQLQTLFTIIMALAITEGLKQFVREIKDSNNQNQENDTTSKHLRWKCFPGLIAFLVTAMPFLYGMARYFHNTYKSRLLGEGYAWPLLFDTLAFTTEALLFFVMSRSVSPSRSLAFSMAALGVFLVDALWVWKCKLYGPEIETWWNVQDLIAVTLLLLFIVLHLCDRIGAGWLYVAACGILLAHAVVDLPLNWSFYFPEANKSRVGATEVPSDGFASYLALSRTTRSR
jgi:hypothetical protein